MDDEYDGEANADLTLGIVSKARNRANTQLALSPETQAFFESQEEEPQEVIEITSDGDDEKSVEIVSDKRRLDGGIPAANPKRRKPSRDDAVEVQRGEKGNKKVKKKKRSKKSAKENQRELSKENKRRREQKEDVLEVAAPLPAEESPTTTVAFVKKKWQRYFEPPEEGRKCFRCGEAGHLVAACPVAPRPQKNEEVVHDADERTGPCYACGDRSHNSRSCKLRVECSECGRLWHRSENCPDKVAPACLLCGDSGHRVDACSKYNSPEDLKEVKCYVCRQLGHLCCLDGLENTPHQPSCYNCGETGHTGMSCEAVFPVTPPASDPVKPAKKPKKRKCSDCGDDYRHCNCISRLVCYRCGQPGHFSRECKGRLPADEGRRTSLPRWTDTPQDPEVKSFNLDHNKRQRRGESHSRLPKWYEVERTRQR